MRARLATEGAEEYVMGDSVATGVRVDAQNGDDAFAVCVVAVLAARPAVGVRA